MVFLSSLCRQTAKKRGKQIEEKNDRNQDFSPLKMFCKKLFMVFEKRTKTP
jgi:hypothetical protein